LKKNAHTVERMSRLLLGLVSLSLTFMGTKTAWGVFGGSVNLTCPGSRIDLPEQAGTR
jgi:hypothetical protein